MSDRINGGRAVRRGADGVLVHWLRSRVGGRRVAIRIGTAEGRRRRHGRAAASAATRSISLTPEIIEALRGRAARPHPRGRIF